MADVLPDETAPGLWLWNGKPPASRAGRGRAWLVIFGAVLSVLAVLGAALPHLLVSSTPQPMPSPSAAKPLPVAASPEAPARSDAAQTAVTVPPIDQTAQIGTAQITAQWGSPSVVAKPSIQRPAIKAKATAVKPAARPHRHRPREGVAVTTRETLSPPSPGSLGCPPSICFPWDRGPQ